MPSVRRALRQQVGGVRHEGGEERRLGDPVRGPHDVEPDAEVVDRRVEPAHEDVQDAAREDDAAAAACVHEGAERRPPEDRRRRGHAHDDADPDLVGAELVQEPGEVEIEREREVLEEVRGEAEHELPRDDGGTRGAGRARRDASRGCGRRRPPSCYGRTS